MVTDGKWLNDSDGHFDSNTPQSGDAITSKNIFIEITFFEIILYDNLLLLSLCYVTRNNHMLTANKVV